MNPDDRTRADLAKLKSIPTVKIDTYRRFSRNGHSLIYKPTWQAFQLPLIHVGKLAVFMLVNLFLIGVESHVFWAVESVLGFLVIFSVLMTFLGSICIQQTDNRWVKVSWINVWGWKSVRKFESRDLGHIRLFALEEQVRRGGVGEGQPYATLGWRWKVAICGLDDEIRLVFDCERQPYPPINGRPLTPALREFICAVTELCKIDCKREITVFRLGVCGGPVSSEKHQFDETTSKHRK